MKKILLFFIVLGALTSINFNLFASVSYQGITLDTPINDLNNYTLREVFGAPQINITNVPINQTTTFYGTQDFYVPIGETYYVIARSEIVSGSLANVQIQERNPTTITYSINNGAGTLKTDPLNTNQLRIFWYILSSLTATLDIEIIRLDQFALESAPISLLDYYSNLYYALDNGIDLSLFYQEGYDNGYDTGYDDGYLNGEIFGYDDGYTDGLNEGYFNGQVDYYNGTYLAQLPAETSTPYNDGQVDGYQYGYATGFDDGIVSDVDTSWVLGFTTGAMNVLGVSIIPGITLGVFVFVPLFFGFVGFIYRVGKRGG